MGRKGSKLIPFLMDGLNKNKYNNLKFEDVPLQIFSLFLPQNTTRLGADCQFILKDWYNIKNRPYKLKKDYTEAKQGMEAALRKSDFLEVVHKGRNTKMIYRILNPLEIQAKKFSKKAQKKTLKDDPYDDSKNFPSPESSGYGSGSDNNEVDVSHALMDSLAHDHGYNWVCGDASLNEIKSEEDFNFVTLPLFPIESDALLQENGLKKMKMEPDENTYPMQLGFLEDVEFVINNEDLLYDSALPFEPLENYVEPYQNCTADPDLVTIYPDGTDSKHDSSFMLNFEDDKLMNEVIMDQEVDLFADSEGNSEEISTSGFDIISYKTKTVKVYECLHRMDMPDMTMLTCEPKLDITSVNEIPEENQDIYENDANGTINVQAQSVTKPIDAEKSLPRNLLANKSGIQAAIDQRSNLAKPKDVKCDLFGKCIALQPREEKPDVDYDVIGQHIALQLGELPLLDMIDARTEIQQILIKYKNKVLR